MREWIIGGLLTAAAAGGVYVAIAGTPARSHCGPCLMCANAVPACETEEPVFAPLPSEPNKLPFATYAEPPLAKPVRSGPGPVVQASYVEPIIEDGPDSIEVAPQPRMLTTRGAIPLYSPNDPF